MVKRILSLVVLVSLLPFLTGATIVIRGPRTAAASITYIYNLDYEATGTPSGWVTGSGIDYDYSADPLEGSESLRITGPSVNTYAVVNNTELWGKMKLRIGSTAANSKVLTLIDSGFNEHFRIYVLNGGALYVDSAGGSAAQTTDTLSANTEYFVWWHFNGATVMSVEFSTTDSRVGSGNKYASTTGVGDTMAYVFLYSEASTTTDFDNVQIAAQDIP